MPSFFLCWNNFLVYITLRNTWFNTLDRKSSSYSFSHSLPPTEKKSTVASLGIWNQRGYERLTSVRHTAGEDELDAAVEGICGNAVGIGRFVPVEVLLFFGAISFVGNVYGLAWKLFFFQGNASVSFRGILLQSLLFSKENSYSVSSFDCDNTCVDDPLLMPVKSFGFFKLRGSILGIPSWNHGWSTYLHVRYAHEK